MKLCCFCTRADSRHCSRLSMRTKCQQRRSNLINSVFLSQTRERILSHSSDRKIPLTCNARKPAIVDSLDWINRSRNLWLINKRLFENQGRKKKPQHALPCPRSLVRLL